MSVEAARDRVVNLSVEGEEADEEFSEALDDLIREVKASMPCYRLFDDHIDCEGRAYLGEAAREVTDLMYPGLKGCVTCAARAEKVKA